MAKVELKGFDEYIRQLEAIEAKTTSFCKAVVYPGAKELADAMSAEVAALPTITDAKAMRNYRDGYVQQHLSESQKAGLQDSLGITPIGKNADGVVSAAVGFTGYNGVKTKKFPNGQPNAEVARSLEKGTSYLQRDAFATRAVRKCRARAKRAMQSEADAQMERILNQSK